VTGLLRNWAYLPCVLGLLVAVGALAADDVNRGARRYASPDKTTIAAVGLCPGTKTDEGEVHISDALGASRLTRSFTSADGEHGLVIEQAAWSPDSHFFVFTGSSSGGHQPWHSPMFVYSRARNAIYQLDKCIPNIAVVEPGFRISSPNLVRVTIATSSAGHGLDEHFRHETYSLSDVVRQCQHK
jgi:hypothetical protein